MGYFKNQKIQNCLAPNLRQFGNQISFFYGSNLPLLSRFDNGWILTNLDLERGCRKKKILQTKGQLNYEFKQYKSKFKQLNTIGS